MIKNVAYYNSKIDAIAQEMAEEAARAGTLFAPMIEAVSGKRLTYAGLTA